MCSVFVIEGALSTPMNRSDHVAEVVHAEIEASALSPHAVVQLFLVLLGIIWGISDTLTILFLGVATPHAVKRLFSSQEVISFFLQHCGVANVDSYKNIHEWDLYLPI